MTHTASGRPRSLGLKLLLVGAIVFLLGIPLIVINVLAWERAGRADEIAEAVGQAHGGPQTVRGPYLIIPFEQTLPSTARRAEGSVHSLRHRRELIILSPDQLDQTVVASTQILRRAIYEAPVYQALVSVNGYFNTAGINAFVGETDRVLWDEAQIVFALTDLRGIDADIQFSLGSGSNPLAFEPRSELADASGTFGWRSISATVPGLAANSRFDFVGEMQLSGARQLALTATGRETRARMTSNWAHPGFTGAYLPDTREISSEGFTAEWSIPYLARGVPARWIEGDGYSIQTADEANFAVNLVTPTDGYVRVSRSLKYAMAFLGFTLLMFFLVEASGGRALHAAQYVLIGMTQITFYLLLLALSEHVPLWTAYSIAALATIIATSTYARSAFGDMPRAMGTMVGLTLAFLVQFILILIEDYALLIGSALVFTALATTMYLTRRVDWYALADRSERPT